MTGSERNNNNQSVVPSCVPFCLVCPLLVRLPPALKKSQEGPMQDNNDKDKKRTGSAAV